MSKKYSEAYYKEMANKQFEAMDPEAQEQWSELRHRLRV